MRHLVILGEGLTEKVFATNVLIPHLQGLGVQASVRLLETGERGDGSRCYGGVTSYEKIRRDVRKHLHDNKNATVTTMLDYYGLPKGVPGAGSGAKSTHFIGPRKSAAFAAFAQTIALRTRGG